MTERESLAQMLLGMNTSDREKWLAEHWSREESYPWQPRVILPEQRRFRGFFNIDIIGLPESGKTTAYQNLLEKLPESFPGIKIVGIPEFGEDQDRAKAIRELITDEFTRNAYLNALKTISFRKGLFRITDLLLEDSLREKINPEPKILVCERGLVDEGALAFRVEGVGGEDTELRKLILRVFLEDLTLTEVFVDAVVVYGVSLDTAKQRRRARGLPPEGRVTNKSVWPGLERLYSWWLGSIYPLLHQRQGTGLLVIDGEGDEEENNLAFLNYVKEAVALTF